ncbi:sulfatase-like hydrolase/transferase [Akkermansiaceae bacterium]|nr:sulfatase-like hydrolase/transferase [Akkermansiaceae bacterium]MDB4290388.1 sulfatase-like hydrolase/transferase [bacterium]MDB4297928.1 sulfatase-like hydrolase/transferase [bacterium]MDB4313288.1 sulfatase-like hydrolase/transferase [Akkermansiaceae bacterium]MDB4321779.1 sulfatase-like hydrolase/transferase [Akkermansiaceae bacterium]
MEKRMSVAGAWMVIAVTNRWWWTFQMIHFLAIFLLLSVSVKAATKPNVVIIFCDHLGYADIGCFGAKGYKTPHIDSMACEGARFRSA